jgi:tRNA modification GTPase
MEAHLAHHVDFPEEDDAPVPVGAIAAKASGVAASLADLLRTAPEGELLREGAVVVLAGRPNVGKSSLYNALLGTERAIVTEIPGTTRDALDASVQLGGYPFRLVDTAGLRQTVDPVERIGVEVARRALARADLVLLCVEGEAEDTRAEEAFLDEGLGVPVVLVRTKCERRDGGGRAESPEPGGAAEARISGSVVAEVRTSVRTGEGLDSLRELLPALVFRGLVEAAPDDPVVTNRRQAEAMRRGREEIEQFRSALEDGVPAEMAATHLRAAESALEDVIGVVVTDDVLDVVFRNFCVGK